MELYLVIIMYYHKLLRSIPSGLGIKLYPHSPLVERTACEEPERTTSLACPSQPSSSTDSPSPLNRAPFSA